MRLRMPKGAGLRKGAAATVIGAVAISMVTLAVVYPGFATADVSLNDGGVWVTRSQELMVGHLNYPSHALDGGLHSTAADFTLMQDGNNVLMYDPGSGAVVRIDPAKVVLAESGGLAANSKVAFRGGTIGMIDAQTNALFAARFAQVQGLSTSGRDPIAELGGGSAVAVSTSGAVVAVSSENNQLVTLADPDAQPETKSLPKFGDKAELSITAVGDVPVVLDSANGVVYTPDRTIQVPDAKQGRLQAAGAANDQVVIATPSGLISQPLDGSKPSTLAVTTGGTPAEPYWLNGCAYGVWSVTGVYARDCPGTADDRSEAIPGATGQPQLTLRQNRNVIVINELTQGTVWLINDAMIQVNNWQDVIPPEADQGKEESKDKQEQFKLPERSPQNHKPDAVDDKFGARAGDSTVLNVLENDTDPDGDLLVASVVGTPPPGLSVQPIRDGAALQVAVGKNVSGPQTIRYQVNDGREGGTDEANITLDVRPPGDNAAPVQRKIKTAQVEVRSKVSYDALQGWEDPEGDDLYLKSATSAEEQVTFRSNGVVQITEATGENRPQEIKIVVSDGTNDTTGILRLDVRPKRTLAPIANSDRYSTLADQPLTMSPLGNDSSSNGDQLRLANVPQLAGAQVVPNYGAGTITFSSSTPGAYYLPYLVTNGPFTGSALIRIDVKPKNQDGLDPTAGRDTALLPTSREVLVDVLANDTDPTGGILVVQSVTVPTGARVSAEVLEHRVIRVRDAGGLNAPVTLTYRVASGDRSTEGQIRVLPVQLPTKPSRPVVIGDAAVVRAGDIVTVDVLANDYHPDGDSMTLLPQLLETPDPADGVAFVSEDKVRFKAGPTAKQVSLVYQVTDSRQQSNSGRLLIQIVAADGANTAPRPEAVEARVIAGTSVRIPVPLNGIDPEGDSIELVGTGSAPQKGQVSVGDSWLVYKAYPGTSGRDAFEYVVRDRNGALATGTVVVGVAAPSNINQAPYTAPDNLTVRPGRLVSVPVLANDSDPDGDDISLQTKSLSASPEVEAKAAKNRVVVKTPNAPGPYNVTYYAVDTFGAKSPGNINLNVTDTAPLIAPTARDDRVPATDVAAGKPTVVVPVLANDEDPDGVVDDCTLTVDDPNVTVRSDKSLEVKLAATNQLILYTITDQDGQKASAVVFVPGTDSLLPTLKSAKPVEVVSGQQVRLPLADYVLVRPGRSPKVADGDSVRSGHGDGSPLTVDAQTLQYTSAKDYFGPDAVSLLVTDGADANDAKGVSAFVSIPITVIPATNQPPTLANTSVQVAPGEEPVELNLRKLVTDPDPGDVVKVGLEVTAVPAGFHADLNGDIVKISADSGVPQGTVAEITVKADDHSSAPTLGKVAVTVVSSQRPLPVAVDDIVPSIYQGQPVTVPVLANDQPNPFPDVPLKVIDARVISGQGTATTDGTTVVVTPDAAFVGTLQVRYRIQDATKAPERQAEATIIATVQGAPDQPGRPVVESVGDRTVVLSWTPPANNGRPITSYTVSSSVKGFTQKCQTTTCTLTGLTNDVEYTFTVVATNDVGDSVASLASGVARPDVRPDQPQPPVLKFGDKFLNVTWTAPHSSGSAITSYRLEISPSPEGASGQVEVTSGTSYKWEGLTNGTSYQVRVQAVNRAPDPSDWSSFSVGEVPAGKPAAPGTPTTTAATPVGSQAQIKVTWPGVTGDAANGDVVSDYTLVVYQGGSEVGRFTQSGTSRAVNLDPSQTDFTFKVSARNKAGSSELSAASAPRRAAIAPGAPQDVVITPQDGRVKITFTAGALNGNKASELTYHYKVTPSGNTGTVTSGGTIGGLNNGTSYKVELWATSSVAGVATGDSATSNSAIPFGKPIITLDGIDRLDNAVRFRWHVNSNGRSLTSANPGVDGSGNGSKTVSGLAAGASTTLDVSYTNEAGTSTASWSGQANDPPAVTDIWKGGSLSCSFGTCNYVGVTLNNNYSGTLSVCAKGKLASGGSWDWWSSSLHCSNTSFSNGRGQTGFWLETNNNQTYDIEISISGYASRVERIW